MTNPPTVTVPEPYAETLVSARNLVSTYEAAGYSRAHPAILQPAEPFLDLSGEDIRARMFLTAGRAGEELCLRPDFTIPVSRDYLHSPAAGRPQGYCYLGPVFRDRGTLPGEFLQAGIESFGRTDKAAADAETLALGLAATAHFGRNAPSIMTGDVALFTALVSALDLAPAWKRRLIKDFNRKASLAQDLERLTLHAPNGKADYQGVLAALAGSDPKAARALVTDLLSIAGISAVGGRSVGEIADRFLEQSTLGAAAALPRETHDLVVRFLNISGTLDDAATAMRRLAAEGGLSLDAALDHFEARSAEFRKRNIDARRVAFSCAFGRGMDYYTGFVFELRDGGSDEPLVAGGRYDDLLTRLGSPSPIPAVGFSVWIERLSDSIAGGAS
ncbi:MAG: ATP phosphoribosyltransferase regulatory subunit [Pseudorhodoplanes sp.]|uniref:ATP phosphoribosyltransferase regulatory subunit n=1 Tax=Pseudorhodoplanes sp. TaxID=1934341 RepID=UPI003D0F2CCB